MMNSFCQFILLILLLAQSGCSWFKPPKVKARNAHHPTAAWFQHPTIRLTDLQGQPVTHLFYDPAASLNSVTGRVNFLPLSLAGDERAYELDILSGQRYFGHIRCGQKDVWRERGSVSGKATYSMGIVPRHFDQLSLPQRIVVFGGADHYELLAPTLYGVHIVGGYVEEICAVGRCAGPKDWIGRIVLVAVDRTDHRFQDVKTLAQLRAKIDWDDVRSQLENLSGRNSIEETDYPASRVGNFIDAKQAIDFMLKHSVIISPNELSTMQNSCAKIYDIIWKEAGEFTQLDMPAITPDEVRARAKFYEALKKKNKAAYFGQRLGGMLQKYGNELATCSRLVYAGDPNSSGSKYKFQMWVNMYVSLHNAGWEYDCQKQAWSTTNRGSSAMTTLVSKASTCTAADYDKAMEYLPDTLKALRLAGQRWRFVAWDEHAHGSHAKILNWVRAPEKKFACDDDMNVKIRQTWREQPDEMEWVRRHDSRGHKDSGYIY